MISTRRFVFAGILAYLFFLLHWMPADVLAWLVAKQTHQRVLLTEPKGTFWDGRAQPYVSNGTQSLSLDSFHWHFEQSRLLRGQLAAQLNSSSGSRALLATTADSLTLENTELRLPASLLGIIFPALSLWQPDGILELKASALRLGGGKPAGQANLLWKNAATSLSRVRPLGDYAVDINANQRGVDYTLKTLNGPLTINGNGYWRSRDDWTFTGYARPRPDRQAALQDLLQLFSRQREGDQYLLQFSARRETRRP